jgi:hypothetical protein
MVATVRLLSVVFVMAAVIDPEDTAELAYKTHSVETCHMTQTECGYVITTQKHGVCDGISPRNFSTMHNDQAKRDDIIISRLNAMQDRLTRMINELSFRTLRHIRQIKTSLHRVGIFLTF